ncbi:MAG: decarboxylase [Calothrix sp. SM1_7_51]|nr:decarboxylase [Calothrix sp. SM1_7_51]
MVYELGVRSEELGVSRGTINRVSTRNFPFSLELAEELLNSYGSPLYVYQNNRLRQTIERITQAFSYPRTQFCFASVTNGNIALLRIFRESNWGLHANTPGDVYLGIEAGFHPKDIVYSGSNLNRAEFELLLKCGIKTLNLDSIAQLNLCCEVYQSLKAKNTEFIDNSWQNSLRFGLRLNLPEITGNSRIGVRPEEFSSAISITDKAGLKLSGLHFYRGTGTNATKAFTQVIDRVIAIAQQLPDWEYLDFGGGFGYPYRQGQIGFDWEVFGAEISERISRLERKIDLIIEPGRAAIAECACLLAKVVSVKWQEEKQILGVDTTVANLSVPSVHGGYREIITWKQNITPQENFNIYAYAKPSIYAYGFMHLPNKSIQNKLIQDKSQTYLTDVCGNTTYSRDYLGRNCQLPALEINDIIAILDVGAYGYAMSSHFLHRPKPAEILLDNHTHRLIRQRENYNVLLANQIF